MSFPPGIVAPLALAEHEIAKAFDPPVARVEVHISGEGGGGEDAHDGPHPLGLFHRAVSSIGKALGGGLFTGPVMAGISIAAAGALIVSLLAFLVHAFGSFEERLREEGRAEIRASVSSATIKAQQAQIQELAAQAQDYAAKISELETQRQEDARAHAALVANFEEASRVILATPSKCVRPDSVIDAINKVLR